MRTLSRLPRPRDVLNEFGIYVHIPFCSHRCWYCDFNTYAGLEHLIDQYMDALAKDACTALSAPGEADLDERPVVTSVFIGGGTPSLVEAAAIDRVLRAIRDGWTLAREAEITIECNPESIDGAKLDSYLESGINRVSFGVQSLDDDVLRRLGRMHDSGTALRALELARSSGFQSVSADLIFGVPGESDEAWKESLHGVLEKSVDHLSCYALIYEEGTPLESWKRLGKVVPVPDDDVARRWEMTDAVLRASGFERYEISNWSRPSFESRHNTLYWKCGEYLGIGAGAHSHLAAADGAVRSWVVKGAERYARAIARGERPVAGSEPIDNETRASEVMLLGLRRTSGVRYDDFEALSGVPMAELFGAEIEAGARRGLLASDGTGLRLQRPFLANEATVLFV